MGKIEKSPTPLQRVDKYFRFFSSLLHHLFLRCFPGRCWRIKNLSPTELEYKSWGLIGISREFHGVWKMNVQIRITVERMQVREEGVSKCLSFAECSINRNFDDVSNIDQVLKLFQLKKLFIADQLVGKSIMFTSSIFL